MVYTYLHIQSEKVESAAKISTQNFKDLEDMQHLYVMTVIKFWNVLEDICFRNDVNREKGKILSHFSHYIKLLIN